MTARNVTTLQSGCKLHSNESNVIIELPSKANNTELYGWNVLSSATHNGGRISLPAKDCGVINIKVPASYDGIHPEPVELIRTVIAAANKNDVTLDANATVGMMTAAHMKTLKVATRSSLGVIVEAIVTAGISNARAAGADADCFFVHKDQTNATEKTTRPSPGTINTVVIINAPLSESALVEAFAIAIEAKCAACVELSVMCAKSGKHAQGTGTDCMVLICPSTPLFSLKERNNPDKNHAICNVVEYAGKHVLLGEFIGQAVKEATREAILCNIRDLYGTPLKYHCHRYWKWITNLLLCGAQPCVPLHPMMPVPSAPTEVLVLGVALILFSYLSGIFLPRNATILLASAAWDRCVELRHFQLTSYPFCFTNPFITKMSAICSSCNPPRSTCRTCYQYYNRKNHTKTSL
jgi:adenosylcobinamide hydrolase